MEAERDHHVQQNTPQLRTLMSLCLKGFLIYRLYSVMWNVWLSDPVAHSEHAQAPSIALLVWLFCRDQNQRQGWAILAESVQKWALHQYHKNYRAPLIDPSLISDIFFS